MFEIFSLQTYFLLQGFLLDLQHWYYFIMSQDQQQRKNTFLDVPVQREQSSRTSVDSQREKQLHGSATKKSYESQIHQLKEKAHKSFLQVIQMQHLHQQQLEELRKQYEEKQLSNKAKIKQLELKIQKLDKQLKLGARHILDMPDSSFVIENIEGINCTGDISERSRLEESSIQQIQQILDNKNELQETMKQIQKEFSKQFTNFKSTFGNNLKSIKFVQIAQKLMTISWQLSQENINLLDALDQVKRKDVSLDLEKKNIFIQLESSKKQIKYLSQHIKRIHEDKEKLQRKLNRSETHRKKVQQQLRTLKKSLNQSLDFPQSQHSILSQSIQSSRHDTINYGRIDEYESTIIQNQSHILNDTKLKDQSLILKKQEPHFQRQPSYQTPHNLINANLKVKKSQTINENKQPSQQQTPTFVNFFKKKKAQDNS